MGLVKRLFSFDEFVTPRLMRAFFLVMMGILLIVCAASLIMSVRAESWDGVLSSFVVLAFGFIMIRVACDVVLVLFRMYDVLRDLRDASRAPISARPTAASDQNNRASPLL